MTTYDIRRIEIEQLYATEGIEPPMPVEFILAIEDAGGAVDLVTGAILHGAADWLVEPTVVGQATMVVNRLEEGA